MRFTSVAEFLDPTNGHRPTTAERKLIKATQAGEACYLCDENIPSLPAEATDETRIRAALLRLLITGGSKDCGLHERGVTLYGGWIEGSLDFAYCTTRGQTELKYCTFSAQLQFEYALIKSLSLDNSTFPGLFGRGAQIKGDLILRNSNALATVDVQGARIGGQFLCKDAVFSGRTNFDGGTLPALRAQGAEIGDSLFLSNLVANGMVNIVGVKIGGVLTCEDARLDGGTDKNGKSVLALNAQRMRVSAGFFFRNLKGVNGPVDLTAAKVGGLVDDSDSWPKAADQVFLDGFTYDRIAGSAPSTFADRRAWLFAGSHLKGEFLPQPYTQLARVLRQMGHIGEARKVLMERTSLQAQAIRESRKIVPNGDISVRIRGLLADIRNGGHWLFDRIAFRLAGYGHAPLRSLWSLVILVLAATALAHLTWEEGSFAPNSDVILVSPGWAEATARDCFPVAIDGCDPNPANTWANTFTASAATPTQGADWDSFNRYGYAADLVIPFLDLGQTDAWAPSKDRGDWGWVLWWARWVLAALGWIVTGLGVAAVTGVMQRNQPD